MDERRGQGWTVGGRNGVAVRALWRTCGRPRLAEMHESAAQTDTALVAVAMPCSLERVPPVHPRPPNTHTYTHARTHALTPTAPPARIPCRRRT